MIISYWLMVSYPSRDGTTHSRLGHPASISHQKKCPTDQSDGGSPSAEFPLHKCVKLSTKVNYCKPPLHTCKFLHFRVTPPPFIHTPRGTTYHSVGKVAEVLNQHLLDHVRFRNDNIHPTTKIVPGKNQTNCF